MARGTTAKPASSSLTVRQASYGLVMRNFGQFVQLCECLSKSGKTGSLRTKEQIVACALQGAELGIGPMASLNTIFAIEGRLSLASQLCKALVLRDFPGSKFTTTEGDGWCQVTLEVPGRETETVKWTIEDAQRAGLVKKGSNWEKTPKQMLYSRATSEVCRRVCPDVLAGMYTPDELGADIDYDGVPVQSAPAESAPVVDVDYQVNGKPLPPNDLPPHVSTPPTSAPTPVPTPVAAKPDPAPPIVAPVVPPVTAPVPKADPAIRPCSVAQKLELKRLKEELQIGSEEWLKLLGLHQVKTANDLPDYAAGELIATLRHRKINADLPMKSAGAGVPN